ncbi:MAG: 3-isopropylmalate dehydratase large subunit [Spirochaetales bacterium]|nr:3-isopropylmalate dehydratase large subunit [Spirochaetales bacterium]
MTGRIWKFGNDVDTDQIIASQYLLVSTVEEMTPFAFESIRTDFAANCRSGDVVVGGSNFGCGSSREQAPMVLKALGVQAVVAKSFARIFYRNAINIGLPVVVSDDAVKAVPDGASVDMDIAAGTLVVNDSQYGFTPFPDNIKSIVEAGGLLESINSNAEEADEDQKPLSEPRPMTLTEKILAHSAGRPAVKPGDIVTVPVDRLMTNDATTHVSVGLFENKLKKKSVAIAEKTVGIIDHNVPAESVKTAHVQNTMRRFCREQSIALHDGEGVCHQLLAEYYIMPGDIVIGADSHTPASGAFGAFAAGVGSTDFVGALATGKTWLCVPQTIQIQLTGSFPRGADARDLMFMLIGDIGADGALYSAIEFCGEGVSSMTMPQRMILCAMAVEAGVKNAVIAADTVTRDFLQASGRGFDTAKIFSADDDAVYAKKLSYDLDKLVSGAAVPHGVHKYAPLKELEDKKIKIDQGFIGSCSAGGIEALRTAAQILKTRRVHPLVKLIITPASRKIMQQAVKEGLVEAFITAGAMVMNPNCSVCWGACQGVLGKDEVMISTGTRNFKGRSGSPESYVYLASAAAVAVSAIEGFITDPRRFLE